MTSQNLTKNYGASAMFIGATVGGAVAGSLAQNKVKFFDSMIGRLILIILGVMVYAKSKSETVKGLGAGIAVSGATGFIKNIAGSINGIEGLAGIDGMGQIVQDENGMIYMVNGVGELEPYDIPVLQGDSQELYGYGVGAAEAAVLV